MVIPWDHFDTQQKIERIGLQWKGSIPYFNSNILVTPCFCLTKCQEGTAQRKGLWKMLQRVRNGLRFIGFSQPHSITSHIAHMYLWVDCVDCVDSMEIIHRALHQVNWSTLESAETGWQDPRNIHSWTLRMLHPPSTSPSLQRSHAALPGPFQRTTLETLSNNFSTQGEQHQVSHMNITIPEPLTFPLETMMNQCSSGVAATLVQLLWLPI